MVEFRLDSARNGVSFEIEQQFQSGRKVDWLNRKCIELIVISNYLRR